MNYLNSILLEGILESAPVVKDGIATFVMSHHMDVVNEGVAGNVDFKINCTAFEGTIMDTEGRVGELKKGRRVRVVGVLRNDGNGFNIYCSHVEVEILGRRDK